MNNQSENKPNVISQDELNAIYLNQKNFFNSGATIPYKYRISKLKELKKAIVTNRIKLQEALYSDLHKGSHESYMTEVGLVLYELSYTIKNLKKWMKPKKVKTPFFLKPGKSQIACNPLGLTLIISPFNYPVKLTFSPLISSIAAGNCTVIKTSELSKESSIRIAEILNNTFKNEFVYAINGGDKEFSKNLLTLKWDHIFFTGSSAVGKEIVKASVDNYSRVTLELGGKTPGIIHSDAELSHAANKIVYGKFLNSGQTCIAPDYLLIHESVRDKFLKKLKERIIKIYGANPYFCTHYGRIINDNHFLRLTALIDKNKVYHGGSSLREDLYIEPTLLEYVSVNDPIMKEEIFGPLLPVLTYKEFSEVKEIIKHVSPQPLAAYLFADDKNIQKRFENEIECGGSCINHTIQHIANVNLPFGGIGKSGTGSYNGYHGFIRFSHEKSIMKYTLRSDSPIIYPPYTGIKRKIVKFLLK